MLFLLDLPRGEEVTILAQQKKDGERGGGGPGASCGQLRAEIVVHVSLNQALRVRGERRDQQP